ncbi:HvfC/BufC N-terminal domain-containing protein [Photobacterium atrarenae]|uniref:DNA-binding domain-containing protein n=1 Tax=Photobacterium atrarenae TaxID=865757 RepID=A0ABY5GFR6_9GAMM|nr:DNA-binding domain-containing protein [Photobacterium atrarenae]UTV27671.1 DNA-binding domain-containing protein [Photobacterium atrarenae]
MTPLSPPDLRQLQQDFAAALHYQPSPVATQVEDGTFTAEQRLQLYRNNFIISLSEVLAATYPAVKAVVGDTCFAQLARQHILSHPLQHGDVSHYGAGLADTIGQFAELTEAVPYLADLARLEWLVDQAGHAPVSRHAFPFAKLQSLASSNADDFARLQLIVPEATFCLDADYPVATLWQMITSNQIEAIDINQTESAVIQHRPDQVAVIRACPAGTGLVRLSLRGEGLGQASEAMLAELGALVQQQVFSDIQGLPQGEA